MFLKPPANVTRRDKWPNYFYSYATALRSDRVEQFNELLDLFRNYFNSTLKPGTQDPLFALQEEEPYFLSEEEVKIYHLMSEDMNQELRWSFYVFHVHCMYV